MQLSSCCEMQGTHEELIELLEDGEASERSVGATVQMLRLLAMPPGTSRARSWLGGSCVSKTTSKPLASQHTAQRSMRVAYKMLLRKRPLCNGRV